MSPNILYTCIASVLLNLIELKTTVDVSIVIWGVNHNIIQIHNNVMWD